MSLCIAWGADAYGQTDVPSGLANVVAISSGAYHALALKRDGAAVAWGWNNDGQTNLPANLSNGVIVACGGYYNLALQAGGTVASWGDGTYGQTNPPAGLTTVAALAGGMNSALAIGNLAPQANSQNVSGYVNHDLVIGLNGSIGDGNALNFRINTLPASGTLYQYSSGTRGSLVAMLNTPVNDSDGRVIFAPGTNGLGDPYDTFSFMANDGQSDSAPAQVTVGIRLPAASRWTSTTWGGANGGFELNLSGSSNATYRIWGSTNLSQWEFIGTATESSPGQYQFSDLTGTNWPLRFYKSSAP